MALEKRWNKRKHLRKYRARCAERSYQYSYVPITLSWSYSHCSSSSVRWQRMEYPSRLATSRTSPTSQPFCRLRHHSLQGAPGCHLPHHCWLPLAGLIVPGVDPRWRRPHWVCKQWHAPLGSSAYSWCPLGCDSGIARFATRGLWWLLDPVGTPHWHQRLAPLLSGSCSGENSWKLFPASFCMSMLERPFEWHRGCRSSQGRWHCPPSVAEEVDWSDDGSMPWNCKWSQHRMAGSSRLRLGVGRRLWYFSTGCGWEVDPGECGHWSYPWWGGPCALKHGGQTPWATLKKKFASSKRWSCSNIGTQMCSCLCSWNNAGSYTFQWPKAGVCRYHLHCSRWREWSALCSVYGLRAACLQESYRPGKQSQSVISCLDIYNRQIWTYSTCIR